MDVLPRTTRQFLDLVDKLTVPQRILLSVVILFALGSFGWIMLQNQRSDFQPLAAGKSFSPNDLAMAEQSLLSAKLNGFQRKGDQLLGPASELEKYNAALAQENDSAPDLGTQMLRQYESLGPFSTDRQRQQMKEALLLQELRLMIRKVPEVDDVRVAVATSDHGNGWNQKPRSTANITLKPKPGMELSPNLAQSLRHVAANMIPNLASSDVTIFDVSKGTVVLATPSSMNMDEMNRDQKAVEVSRRYEKRLRNALSHIQNIDIAVHAEWIPSLKATRSDEFNDEWKKSLTNADGPSSLTPMEYEAGFRGAQQANDQLTSRPTIIPNALTVAVTFPRDFVHQIAKRRASKGEVSQMKQSPDSIEDEVIAQIERTVDRMIPGIVEDGGLSVVCVDPVVPEAPKTSGDLNLADIQKYLNEWKWPLVGLTLVAVVSLLPMVSRRRVPIISEIAEPFADDPVIVNVAEPAITMPLVATPPDRLVQLREDVRSLASSDAAASAAILSRWMSESAV